MEGRAARHRPLPTARRRPACRTGRAAGPRGPEESSAVIRSYAPSRSRPDTAAMRRSGGASVRGSVKRRAPPPRDELSALAGTDRTCPRRRPAEPLPVQLLQRDHRRLPAAAGADRALGGARAGHRRDAGDAAPDRRAADLVAVRACAGAGWRVDHEVDLAGVDPLHHVRRALRQLQDPLHRHAHAPDRRRGAARGHHAEAHVVEAGGDLGGRRLVAVGHRDEHRARTPAARRRRPPAPCRTRSGSRTPRPSPRRSTSSPGPSSASARGKRPNGSTASFTDTCRGWRGMSRSMSRSRSPSISRHASFASDTPIAFDTNGTVRDARGFASITYSSSLSP